ncbi:MAG TPA: virulence protein RhuM/Fic/DOC family protein [Chitinophagaceae bacterium]
MNEGKGKVIFYNELERNPQIEVKLEDKTLWLSQKLIADLFEKDSDTIGTHIKNLYEDGELEENITTTIFPVIQQEGKRKVKREVKFFNLDVILSVGYRVNSKRGTAFRKWSNTVLNNYLTEGYAHNEKLLKEKQEQLDSLKKAVALITKVSNSQSLTDDQAIGLFRVLSDYTYALDILDKYDHQVLEIEATTAKESFRVKYTNALLAIQELRVKFGGSSLFGNEKDDSFQGSLAAIYQTFGGIDLYPSVEEKAANLLYFVIKNHSFSDGNKRIAAFLFVWFLEKNDILYKADGNSKVADNALVALTLMIAESKPEEKEMMTKVVVSLINGKN